MKEDEKIVTKKKGDEITLHWESGYGVNKDEEWIPIERLTSKICYDIITINRKLIKEYTPNPAHAIVYEIDMYLTPEERNYWWRLNHNLISIKKRESKYKRTEEGELVSPTCPTCKRNEESIDHYNNTMLEFREKLEDHEDREIFTDNK